MNLDRIQQPKIQQLNSINIPFPQRIFLSNGISLNVIEAGEQEVVRVDFVFNGGSWFQNQKLQALFTNRMLQEGSNKYTATDIAEKLDYYGAWLELSTSTKHAYITLYSLNKYFRETLEIVESIIKYPVFPEKELSRVLDTNIQQFKVNFTKVDYIAHRNMLSTLFGEEHPCGRLVCENDFNIITPAILKSFHEKHYERQSFFIYLSGKVNPVILECIENIFGKENIRNPKNLPNIQAKILPSSEKRFFTEYPKAMQSAIKLASHSIMQTHPDFRKVRVMTTLFGGYFGSRLMSNIREEKGYTYGISAGILSYPDTGLLVISTETDNQYVEPLIAEVYSEIDKIQNDLVKSEELTMVKNYMLGEMARSYESPFSLSDAWIYVDTNELPKNAHELNLQAVKDITSQEIRDLACKYLNKENFKEIIVGTKKS